MTKIVAALLARNEANRDLKAVLANAKSYADTVLLLDDGSTDDTVQVAIAAGAKVKSRQSAEGMWGNEAPARKELWDWACEEAGDGWIIIQDADMLLVGDPRPLAETWAYNAWAWVLYDQWSPTEYRSDDWWVGHRHPRVWMVCPKRVPEGWEAEWPVRGIHCGHIPTNFPLVACAVEPEILSWRHLAYASDERRVAKWKQYRAKADILTPTEVAHADSILEAAHPARRSAGDSPAPSRRRPEQHARGHQAR